MAVHVPWMLFLRVSIFLLKIPWVRNYLKRKLWLFLVRYQRRIPRWVFTRLERVLAEKEKRDRYRTPAGRDNSGRKQNMDGLFVLALIVLVAVFGGVILLFAPGLMGTYIMALLAIAVVLVMLRFHKTLWGLRKWLPVSVWLGLMAALLVMGGTYVIPWLRNPNNLTTILVGLVVYLGIENYKLRSKLEGLLMEYTEELARQAAEHKESLRDYFFEDLKIAANREVAWQKEELWNYAQELRSGGIAQQPQEDLPFWLRDRPMPPRPEAEHGGPVVGWEPLREDLPPRIDSDPDPDEPRPS